MHDQAKALRGLMEHRSRSVADRLSCFGSPAERQVITVTSGKGGVGKSNIALNLAVALAEAGEPVLLLDVNWGVGNIELLCGLNSPWNLSHVLGGSRRLDEILLQGPHGVTIVPGAGSLAEHPPNAPSVQAVSELLYTLEEQFRFAIVDLGTGMHRAIRRFLADSDRVLIVTTPEPPSIAEAYASIKSLSDIDGPAWEVLVNEASSMEEAESIFQRLYRTTRAFLQKDLAWAGWIPEDAHVPKSVGLRSPLLVEHPHSPASQALRRTARRLINQTPANRPARISTSFQTALV